MRKMTVLLLLLALLLALAGCGNNQARPEHSVIDQSAYYESVRQGLDAGIMDSSTVYYDEASGTLYYVAIVEGEAELYYKSEEGGGLLPSYVYPDMSEYAGGDIPRGLTSDGQGGLWLAIRYGAGQLLLQHIDADGTELGRVDTASILPQAEFQMLAGLVADAEGWLYLHDTADNIHVLDAQGELAFSLESGEGVRQLLQLPGGAVAAIITTPEGAALREVNAAKRSWGGQTELPFEPSRVYSCHSYTLLYSDTSSLYGYDAEQNTSTKLLTWIDCGIDNAWIYQVNLLEDGRILCAGRNDDGTGQLIRLTNSGQATRPDTTVITLGVTTYNLPSTTLVPKFNEAYPDYQVKIINYYDEDPRTAEDIANSRQRQNLDLISGQAPDMFDMEGLPLRQYAAIGLLEDLYPYLDADDEISREDIVPQLLAACDMDGKLYSVAPDFSILTAIGRANTEGIKQGMSYTDVLRLIEQHPQAEKTFAYGDSMGLLTAICSVELDYYVDWQAGACQFDSEDFISLLEFVAKLPQKADPEPTSGVIEMEDMPERKLASGEALLSTESVFEFYSQQEYALLSEGETIFTGLPAMHGSGSAFFLNSQIAMSSQSKNKQGCWLFLRFVLSQQLQESVAGLPSNQAAFDARLEKAMTVRYDKDNPDKEEPHRIIHATTKEGKAYYIYHVPQEHADQLLGLIETTDTMAFTDPFIMDIIKEEAAVFLAGQITADEAAKRIQSRASIYMNEQK